MNRVHETIVLLLLCFAAPLCEAHSIKISLARVTVVEASSTRTIDWIAPIPKPVPYTIRKLIRVTIHSRQDLRKFAREVGATISASAVICGKEKNFQRNGDDMAATYLTDSLGQIPDGGGEYQSGNAKNKHDHNEYYTYLATISRKSFPSASATHYNFLKQVEPICLRIHGTSIGIGEVLTSNVLRIESKKIKKGFLNATNN
jgi:hypothetical protein